MADPRRPLLLGTAIVLVAGWLSTAASGAFGSVQASRSTDDRFGVGDHLVIESDAEGDDVEVTLELPASGFLATYRVASPGGVATDDSDCVQESTTAVLCTAHFPEVDADLGAGADSVSVALAPSEYQGLFADGGAGPDQIAGGPQRAVVRGQGGADELAGGAESDRLIGGPGADALDAGLGADRAEGGGGSDRVHGGGGADRLWGDAGADGLSGDGGADAVHGEDRHRDRFIRCGSGSDFAYVDPVDRRAHPGCERWAVVTGELQPPPVSPRARRGL